MFVCVYYNMRTTIVSNKATVVWSKNPLHSREKSSVHVQYKVYQSMIETGSAIFCSVFRILSIALRSPRINFVTRCSDEMSNSTTKQNIRMHELCARYILNAVYGLSKFQLKRVFLGDFINSLNYKVRFFKRCYVYSFEFSTSF